MTAYYNEIEPYAAEWLRNLIKAGHIAPGVVDERSIEDVSPADLSGFTQCHFFAGVGVWSYALRLAGWPDDRPVWTGSCPCQPFSAAGKGAGFDDERHLWPAFHWLIDQCRPSVVFGEQVASKGVEPWIDLISTDLEGMGYAIGTTPFPSAGVGAPHIRDRTYFVAHATIGGRRKERAHIGGIATRDSAQGIAARLIDGCMSRVVADAADIGFNGRGTGEASDGRDEARLEPERLCFAGSLAHASSEGPQEFGGRRIESQGSATAGFWRDADWLPCRDGKYRPVEPGTFPLAHGATSRVGRLRAYGNAINAEAARVFLESAAEAIEVYDLT